MRCLKNAANESYKLICMHFEVMDSACNISSRNTLYIIMRLVNGRLQQL